jgi:LPS export ABC transporter protein LptC
MRYVMAFMGLGLVIVSGLFSLKSPVPSPTKPQKSDYSFENVTVSLLKNNKKEWSLTARELIIFNNSNRFYLTTIQGYYRKAHQTSTFTFASPTGVYDAVLGRLRLINMVSVWNGSQGMYQFMADEVDIYSSTYMLMGYGNIRVTSDRIQLIAQEMVGNFLDNTVSFSYDVQGTINATAID